MIDDKVGNEYWFEYHCWESSESCDSEIWYRSHQKVKVLSISESGNGETMKERGESGEPRVYKVKFKDGLEWDVFEDELMNSPDEFYRPDPPKNESIRIIKYSEFFENKMWYKTIPQIISWLESKSDMRMCLLPCLLFV